MNASRQAWRVLRTGALSAAENMAVDEALFEQVVAGQAPTTLRLYGWSPPGVSLGYFQPLDARINLDAVHRRGYGLVRRPTGGRAIIHHHEVTYSVCIRSADLACGDSVFGSYREISRGIELGLALLGLPACLPPRRRRQRSAERGGPTICFSRLGGGDMEVWGRKIVGSAQMRRSGVILQHGSIPLVIDLEEHEEILGGGDPQNEGSRALRGTAVGVCDAVGRPVAPHELEQALVEGFRQAFEVELVEEEMDEEARARAQELVAHKYGTEAWTKQPGRRTSAE